MSDPNVTFTKPEDLCPFKVPAETFWEIARFAGDGYDRADLARTRGWSAQYNWGQDGWDFLEPPYYMGGEAGLHPTIDAPSAPPCLNESRAGTREHVDEDELLDRLLLLRRQR